MPRGRPREFDADQALDRATDVFWRQGYDGTSITDLTASIGINAPSLYAAFGNKRQIFDKVMDRYMEVRLIRRAKALSLDDPAVAVRAYLEGVVLDGTMPDHPKGCLMVGGALVCSDANRDVADQLAALRVDVRTDLQHLFARAVEAGRLPAGTDAESLGSYVAAVGQGIAVEAAGGASRQSLLKVVDVALSALPAPAVELMRIAAGEALRQADSVHNLMHTLVGLRRVRQHMVNFQRFTDDILHGHAGIQRGEWILKDDLHLLAQLFEFPLSDLADVLAVKDDLAACRLDQVQNRPPERRLAAA